MKVLLVYPNVSFVMTPQMGLLSLGSYLLDKGIETRICDLSFTPADRFADALIADIKKWDPDIIGISCRTMEYGVVTRLCKEVKTQCPGKLLVAGGPHATMRTESIVPYVDYAVMGEGELAVFDIVKAAADGRIEEIRDIQNVACLRNSEVVKNPLRPLLDLSSQPMPLWSLFDERHFTKHCTLVIKPGAQVGGTFEGSRGCPFNCAYCSNEKMKELYRGLGTWRREKPAAQIRAEIVNFQSRYNNDLMYFVDEVIMTTDQRTRDLRDQLEGLNVPFIFMDRPELISEERVVNLKKAGAYSCSIGIESANEKYRIEYLKRRMKDETIFQAYRLMKKHGVLTHSFIMLGIPGQTREIIKETYELIKSLQPDSAQATTFFPLPGTSLERYCMEHDLMPDIIPSSYYDESSLKYDKEFIKWIKLYTHLINIGAWRKSFSGRIIEVIGMVSPSMLPLFKQGMAFWRILMTYGAKTALQKVYRFRFSRSSQ
jgi:radical SAM superfamily enzyme YgiQ (UPF0313 family)